MYSISRFQQIIKPVMNGRFARHVRKHQADKHSKGFGCQNLLVCMLYAQLGRCASLRTLEQSFCANRLAIYPTCSTPPRLRSKDAALTNGRVTTAASPV